MTPETAIARCTRNGHTSWQNVAKMLGAAEIDVKARYGHKQVSVICDREEDPEPLPPFKPSALRGQRGARLELRDHHMPVIEALKSGLDRPDPISVKTGFTLRQVKRRLGELQDLKIAQCVYLGHRNKARWVLTEAARNML